MELKEKACSLIGHRKVENIEEVEKKLEKVVIELIEKRNVTSFFLGDNGEFNDLAYFVLNSLREKYPIKLISFDKDNNSIKTKEEKEILKNFFKEHMNKNIEFMIFDEYVLVEKCVMSKKAKYLVRNFEMIKRADICLFYFDVNYELKPVLIKNNMLERKRNSGTRETFIFAQEKKKEIINIF